MSTFKVRCINGQPTFSAARTKKNCPKCNSHVTQDRGTEPPFTGRPLYTNAISRLRRPVQIRQLFTSHTKYDSQAAAGLAFYRCFRQRRGDSAAIDDFSHECSVSKFVAVTAMRISDTLTAAQPTGERYCVNCPLSAFLTRKTAIN